MCAPHRVKTAHSPMVSSCLSHQAGLFSDHKKATLGFYVLELPSWVPGVLALGLWSLFLCSLFSPFSLSCIPLASWVRVIYSSSDVWTCHILRMTDYVGRNNLCTCCPCPSKVCWDRNSTGLWSLWPGDALDSQGLGLCRRRENQNQKLLP